MEKPKEQEKQHPAADASTTLASQVTAAEINQQNRKYWFQPGGETFKNHTFMEGNK